MKHHIRIYIELRSVAIRTAVLLAAALLVTATLPAAEFTWGGTLDGTLSATFADHQSATETELSGTAALWMKSLFTPGAGTTVELDIQPSYTWTDDRPYLFDLDRAKADLLVSRLVGPSTVLRGSVGRFRFIDASSFILTDTADGVDFTLSVPGVRIRAAGAYTGLLLNPVSNYRMSQADIADAGDDDLILGPRRLIALTELTFPEVLLRQTVTASYIGQWDLRDADEDAGEDTLSSHYAGLRLSGPIASGLFHEIGFYVSPSARDAGSETRNELGMLGSARLRYYRPDWSSSRFSVGGAIVSGMADTEDNFHTISSQDVGVVAEIPLKNIAYGEISYGLRPFSGSATRIFRDIQTSLTGRTMFRVSDTQPVDSFGATVSGDGKYVGTEVALNVDWRIVSDRGVSVTWGAFYPGTGSTGTFTTERKPEYLLRAQVSASY